MSRKTIDKKDVTADLINDLDKELVKFTKKLNERVEHLVPHTIFQETHTTGWLWWKRTYYTYRRYYEGSMMSVSQIDPNDWEK